MSSTTQSNTTTTQQKPQQKQQHRNKQNNGYNQRSGGKPNPKKSKRSVKRFYRIVPMDRNTSEKGAPPIVKGTKGKNLNKIHEVSGCKCRFLTFDEQYNFWKIMDMEVHWNDARILEITVDPEVDKQNYSDRQRINKSCQIVAGAVRHWHDTCPSLEDEDDDGHTSDDPTSPDGGGGGEADEGGEANEGGEDEDGHTTDDPTVGGEE